MFQLYNIYIIIICILSHIFTYLIIVVNYNENIRLLLLINFLMYNNVMFITLGHLLTKLLGTSIITVYQNLVTRLTFIKKILRTRYAYYIRYKYYLKLSLKLTIFQMPHIYIKTSEPLCNDYLFLSRQVLQEKYINTCSSRHYK